MTTFMTVADVNGDFTVPFSINYTGGEKITVTAEKDSATKTIELFAPSGVVGGGSIVFSGNVENFPLNIGNLTLKGFTGKIQDNAFRAYSAGSGFGAATGLKIEDGVSEIGASGFYGLGRPIFIDLPLSTKILGSSSFASTSTNSALETINLPGVITIKSNAFDNQQARYINIGTAITSIESSAINCARCLELIVLATTPPAITTTSLRFVGNMPAMVIKVPTASLTAYQTATNWSAYASRMIGI